MRIFFIIVFLLATLPMIMTGFLQVGAGAMMYSHSKSIQKSIDAQEARNKPYSDELDVIGHVNERSRVLDGYLALRHPQALDDFRRVSLSRAVPISEFLEAGEKKPSKEFLEVHLSTRAAKVAERECIALRKRLADQCVVRSARTSTRDNGKNITLKATYEFTPKNGIGKFDVDRPLRFLTLREKFEKKGTPSEATRTSLYRKVADMCEKLRRKEGNCGLTRLNIQANSKARRVTVLATMGVLQRR